MRAVILLAVLLGAIAPGRARADDDTPGDAGAPAAEPGPPSQDPPPQPAQLSGTVRERATGTPLPGIVIMLADGPSAITDEAGRFTILDVASGRHALTLSGDLIAATTSEIDLAPGQALDVGYDLDLVAPDGQGSGLVVEIVAHAPVLPTTQVEVTAAVARKVPGTGGDVLKVVENLPGVARTSAGSSALVVWGASPADTGVYVDGVRIPRLYHTGGVRSLVAPDLVRAIDLSPGGWGAAHGRGLGGLVDVELAPIATRATAAVAIDALDASATVQTPLTDHVRAALSARRSHLAWLLGELSSRDVGDLFPTPDYTDVQARVTDDIDHGTWLEANLLASVDDVTRTIASVDPADARADRDHVGFWRAWGHYHHDTADAATVDVVVFVGAESTRRAQTYGAAVTSLADASRTAGTRATWRARLAERASLVLGADAQVVASQLARAGSLALPAREGDVTVFGRPPPDELASDRWSVAAMSAAPFAELDLAAWRGRLHLVPGLRVEPFVTSVSRRTPEAGATPALGLFSEDTTVQPRVAVRAQLAAWLRVHGELGAYAQPPAAEDLSAAFGNPTLPVATGLHRVLGAALQVTPTLDAEVTAFYTTTDHLAVRSPSPTPLLAAALEPIGAGRAVGAQILVRRALADGVFGWLSYTASRAERRDAPATAWRLSDYDQTHVLTALASWAIGRGVELGLRARYATGMPRTPVVGAYYDSHDDVHQPLFGAHNADRLPAFVELDARVSGHVRVGGIDVEAYVDVQNVTDRANAEEIIYSADFSRRGYIRGVPLLPVAGARATW